MSRPGTHTGANRRLEQYALSVLTIYRGRPRLDYPVAFPTANESQRPR